MKARIILTVVLGFLAFGSASLQAAPNFPAVLVSPISSYATEPWIGIIPLYAESAAILSDEDKIEIIEQKREQDIKSSHNENLHKASNLSQLPSATSGSCTIVSTIQGPGNDNEGLAWDGGNLWVSEGHLSTNNAGMILMIDLNGNVLSSFNAPYQNSNYPWPSGLAYDGTYLWSVDSLENIIYKLTTSGDVVGSIPAINQTGMYSGLAWDGNHFWVSEWGSYKIYEIDPGSGQVLNSFDAPDSGNESPYGLAWDGTYLWTSNNNGIYWLDPNTGSILGVCNDSAFQSGRAYGLTWDGHYLWAGSWIDGTIMKISVTTGNSATIGYCWNTTMSTTASISGIGSTSGVSYGNLTLYDDGTFNLYDATGDYTYTGTYVYTTGKQKDTVQFTLDQNGVNELKTMLTVLAQDYAAAAGVNVSNINFQFNPPTNLKTTISKKTNIPSNLKVSIKGKVSAIFNGKNKSKAFSYKCIIAFQPCTSPPTTCTDTCTTWGPCQSNGTQTCTAYTTSPPGCTDGTPPTTQTCTPEPTCTYVCTTWSACQNGTQSCQAYTPSFTPCTGGTPPTTQTCNPPTCTGTDVCTAWGPCNLNVGGVWYQDCVGYVCVTPPLSVPSPMQQRCVPCTYTCTAWGPCQSNDTETCTAWTTSPTGCTGGTVPTQTCTYTPPTCTYTCTAWGPCQSNDTETCTAWTTSPTGCTGGTPPSPRTCTPTCTDTCTTWGPCQSNGTQTCTAYTTSPPGCTDGTPPSTKSCTFLSCPAAQGPAMGEVGWYTHSISYTCSTNAADSPATFYLTWASQCNNGVPNSCCGSIRARVWALTSSYTGEKLVNQPYLGTYYVNNGNPSMCGGHSDQLLDGYYDIETNETASVTTPAPGTYCIVVTLEATADPPITTCTDSTGWCQTGWYQFSGAVTFQ